MSSETHCQWQCSFCLACFQTECYLQQHLEEYNVSLALVELFMQLTNSRSGPPSLKDAELMQMRIAVNTPPNMTMVSYSQSRKIQYVRIQNAAGASHSQKDNSFVCTTERVRASLQIRLVVSNNAVADVPCEEVCVSCFKMFRVVSELIRHTREHSGVCTLKKSYMEELCAKLRKQSDTELRTLLSTKSIARKRLRSYSNLAPDGDDVHIRPNRGAESMTKRLRREDSEPHQREAPSLLDTQQAISLANTTAIELPGVEEPALFLDLPSDPYQPLIDDAIYDPPLFTRLNFPDYVSWVDQSAWLPSTSEVPAIPP